MLPIVRSHVYRPAFAGSYSLKYVLPALVPEMTYESMPVANGQDAGLAWESLVRGGLAQSERERTRKALLDYCGQDTLALVMMVISLSKYSKYFFVSVAMLCLLAGLITCDLSNKTPTDSVRGVEALPLAGIRIKNVLVDPLALLLIQIGRIGSW